MSEKTQDHDVIFITNSVQLEFIVQKCKFARGSFSSFSSLSRVSLQIKSHITDCGNEFLPLWMSPIRERKET